MAVALELLGGLARHVEPIAPSVQVRQLVPSVKVTSIFNGVPMGGNGKHNL